VGGEIFRTHPDRPWGPPSLLYNGHRVFPVGKAARAWCWPPNPVLLNRRAAARYRALASILPERGRFSWNLSFQFS